MANYFMNMYSVSPVLSAQSVVPLSTINHSDAVAISIPSAPNISNNNAVRTSHPHTSHANTHSHMHMVAQPTIVGHRTVQHAAHNSSQQQQQSHGTSHAGHATQHQATTTGAQRSATASRTMTVPCDTPYVCGVCNQGFRKPGSLKKHMRVHMSANVSCDPVSSTDIVINSNTFFCFFFVFCIFLFCIWCCAGYHRYRTSTGAEMHTMRLLSSHHTHLAEAIPLWTMCDHCERSIRIGRHVALSNQQIRIAHHGSTCPCHTGHIVHNRHQGKYQNGNGIDTASARCVRWLFQEAHQTLQV